MLRHAEPTIRRGLPPEGWELSLFGKETTARMSSALQPLDLSTLVTSDEVKSIQTTEILGLNLGIGVRIDSRLGEVRRPWIKSGVRQQVSL